MYTLSTLSLLQLEEREREKLFFPNAAVITKHHEKLNKIKLSIIFFQCKVYTHATLLQVMQVSSSFCTRYVLYRRFQCHKTLQHCVFILYTFFIIIHIFNHKKTTLNCSFAFITAITVIPTDVIFDFYTRLECVSKSDSL